jgi:ActR/RegA family two-component response regulator/anti-sigma regulatory factor (Ser/Thr protein kinase)
VEIAQRNTLRLIGLINGILDLERFEAGRIELRRGPVSAREIVGRAMDSVKAFAAEQSVTLESSATDDVMLGDGERLVQVVVNLVANAVKFSPPGGVVEIASRRLAGAIEVRVSDRGRGISPDELGRIFKRFHQVPTREVREKGGTGLGLAISKAIVDQHGGEIGVESVVDVGTTLWFRIPRMPEEEAGLEALPPHAEASPLPAAPAEAAPWPAHQDRLLATLDADSYDSPEPDILVVDDDEAVLGVLARQFLAAGWPVRVARTVGDALALAARRRPGMMVLDLGLPDGSGFEVVAAFRESSLLHDMPLLVYTGRDLSAEERRRLRLGRTRFMTKSKATNDEVTAAALDLLGSAASATGGT